jgi:hypothetical protein
MNIIGEGFPKEVTGQVKTRQEIYGSINRTTEQLEYLNSRTAFARLVSSVNITDKFNPTSTELKGILNKIGGNKLAQEFVLINGTSKAVNLEATKGETTPRSGIARDGSILNMNAYGLGGLEFGLRAMPGITGADVKTENRGSLRTTTIQIKAWNRVQFEIIDLLYLRLGYSVLFEFGNTIYFENEGKFIRNRPNSLQDGFLNGDYTTQLLLEKIQKLRLESDGNYDAVFGKVVNFSWSFETDGSYNITLTIRSIGDVIESLKINTLLKDVDIKGDDKKEKTDEEPTIESYKDKHQIGRLLYNAKRALAEEPYFHGGSKAISTSDKILTEFPGALLKDIEGIKGKKHFLQQNYSGGEPQYYIRLGSFLAFLEQKVIPKYVKNNVVGDPIIKFDYKDDNYIHQETFQISMDPRVCLVKATIKYDDGTLYYYAKEGEPFSFSFEGSQVGSLMNIYVNFMYILTKVDENLDEDNKCKLIDLLKSICNGINESTGSINQLEPIIDDEINTIKIIDQTSLPTKAKNGLLKALNIPTPDESPILDLYSYNRDGGGSSAGFVRNFGFKTEITPQLATMLTIGAQAAGSVVGEDATSISKLNEGLIDRIKEEVIDANSTPSTAVQSTGASSFSVLDELKLMAVKFLGPGIFTTPVISSNSKTEPLDTKYPNALKNFANAQKELGSKGVGSTFTTPTWDEETIDTYRQAQVDFFKYSIAKNSIEKSTSSVTSGFIPISLNLTLDGISGIKIYNTLRVDTSYLPSNYPGAMDFIVTGLSHKINSNVWTTDITSLMVPKDPVGGTQITDTSNSEGNSGGTNNSPNVTYFQSNVPPNEAKLRARLTRILDDGTQTLGLLTIFDKDETTELYTVATVELPYLNNQNGSSSIPTETYLVNSRQTSKYGKHFWLVGSASSNFKRIPGNNNSDRSWVLIHNAPKAPGWLQGCIGPGPKFNFKNLNAKNNPNGVGTAYLNPAKDESQKTVDRLVNTLFNIGGFKMNIVNGRNPLPTSIDDPGLASLKKKYPTIFAK